MSKIKILIYSLIIFSVCNCLFIPKFASAQSNSSIWSKLEGNMTETKNEAGYPDASPTSLVLIISNVIKILLSFVGAIFLIMVLIAGYQWLFSGGNEEKIGDAKKRIIHSVIGLVIILTAYLLTDFVITLFIAATGIGKG